RRGRPIAAAPCTPRLWRTKSPLRGSLSLSLAATGSGARERPCKMRPRRASMRVAPASREPRSGDFVRQSLGVQGAAAIGRPLRAPCASDFIWHSTLKERNRSHIPNSFAHMLSNQP
ncbi:hypothetical protein, partial [Escherichia coli]|uniref:hypothetical protein n=2 Tax=Escherichia coli TaxID=562 RepID=UPI001964E83E